MTPNHVRLIDSCYPHHSALLATAPEYRPNSQELSRLTYYASNRPGKLTKLTGYLEKRAKSEAAKAKGGNTKSKASLLITLAVLRALTTECRRDLGVFSRPVIHSINVAVCSLPNDMEVAARAASVFTAWTTYTDGGLIGVDDSLTKAYLSVLGQYGRLCTVMNQRDAELQNRTRLLGLAALSGVVASDALYAALPEFKVQIPVIVPPLIRNLQRTPVATLNEIACAIDSSPQPTSPYLAEIQQRPPLSERRAASIHVHIDGEKGPSSLDVSEAALRALKTLFQQSSAAQIAGILQSAVASLDADEAWENVEFCCWMAEKQIAWAQYQYRFAVPMKIVELLLASQDTPVPSARHTSLMAMLTTVFTSPISLINFSTSDVLTNLVALLLRRVAIDPNDALLPALIQCISALGTHVYYADQIQDLAEELITRLVTVQLNGISGRGPSSADRSRHSALRCLVLCLKGLVETANRHGIQRTNSSNPAGPSDRNNEKLENILERGDSSTILREDYSTNPRRNYLSPESWQETVAVLCETDFAVRSCYAEALLTFFVFEVPREPFAVDQSIAEREDGKPRFRATGRHGAESDSTTRLLHAINAAAFHLALSPSLGFSSGPPSEASEDFEHHIQVEPPTPMPSPGRFGGDEVELTERASRRPSPSTPRARLSRALAVLLSAPSQNRSSAATLSDYSYLLNIFTTLHRRVPSRALLSGVPMLVALDTTAATMLRHHDDATQRRARIVKELIGRTWAEIGEIWSCTDIQEHASEALTSLPPPPALKEPFTPSPGTHNIVEDPAPLPPVEPGDQSRFPFVNAERMVSALASCERVQAVLGMDKQSILKRLVIEWTPESALLDSMETQQNADVLRGEGSAALRKISPALMHIDNISLQSVARSGKGVGVGDLREALEGRGNGSSANLALSASGSTLDHISSSHGGLLPPTISRPTSAGRGRVMLKSSPSEVRDVLNKLGVGKQVQTGGRLRSPFPVVQKTESEQKASVLLPPYRS